MSSAALTFTVSDYARSLGIQNDTDDAWDTSTGAYDHPYDQELCAVDDLTFASFLADLATLHLPGIIRLLLASPCTHRVVFIAEYTAESGLYARYIRGRPGEAMRICRALAAKIKWSADFNVEMTTPDGEQLPATKSPLLPLEWLREYGYILRIICLTLLHANGATSVSACFPLSPSDREVFDNILWTGEELGVLFEGKTLPKEWGPDLLKYAQYFIGAVKLLKDALDPNRHFEGMMRCMTQEPGCGEMHKRFPWVVCSGLMLESCQIGIELDLEMKACQRCRAVRYCSVECQRDHWPTHKRTCRKLAWWDDLDAAFPESQKVGTG